MRRSIIILLILNSLLLSGCWDMREINENGLVMAVGIDFKEATNNYTVTVQIPNAQTGGNTSYGTGSTVAAWNCSAEGASVFEAVRNLARVSSKRMTWAHNCVIVIGESLAKHDITSVLDFFTTNQELRMKTMVVVSKGDAKNYIASSAGNNIIIGLSLSDMFRYAPLPGVSVKSSILNLYSAFSSDYSQLLVSGISLKKQVISSDQYNNIIKSSTIALEGAAVFKKTKMIGWLTPEETRGLAWILNDTKDTIVPVVDGDNDNKVTSIEIKSVKSKITSEIIDGIPNFTININGKGNIVEESGPSKESNLEFQKRISELLDEELSKEMKKGIDKVQQAYGSDVLGFAQIVEVQNNKEWKNGLKDEWPETFVEVPVKTQVDIKILSSGLNQEPIRETKGK